jgi:hypothetical protein
MQTVHGELRYTNSVRLCPSGLRLELSSWLNGTAQAATCDTGYSARPRWGPAVGKLRRCAARARRAADSAAPAPQARNPEGKWHVDPLTDPTLAQTRVVLMRNECEQGRAGLGSAHPQRQDRRQRA